MNAISPAPIKAIMTNNFSVMIYASILDKQVPDLELKALGNAVIAWSDVTYEDKEQFLIPGDDDEPEDEDEDEEDDSSDAAEEDDDEDEDPVGELCLTLSLSAEAFREYKKIITSEDTMVLKVLITYKDSDNKPLYFHEYNANDVDIQLMQEHGTKEHEDALNLELRMDYFDCSQFVLPEQISSQLN